MIEAGFEHPLLLEYLQILEQRCIILLIVLKGGDNMWKLKWFLALMVAVLVLTPTAAWAQPSVSGFYGDVSLNGQPVSDGTKVRAWIGGQIVGEDNTDGLSYNIRIEGDYTGATVSFTVEFSNYPAGQTSTWEQGANKKVDLAAVTPPSTGSAVITLSPDEGMGLITVSGSNFNRVSAITLSWAGQAITTIPLNVETDAQGSFSAVVAAPTETAGSYQITATDAVTPSRTAEADFTVAPTTTATTTAITDVDVNIIDPGEDASGTYDADSGVLTLQIPGGTIEAGLEGPQGETGAAGPQGSQGETGPAGPGAPGGPILPIVAIVFSVIAIILAFATRPKIT